MLILISILGGVIIGLLLAVIALLVVKRYQVPLERTLKQTENKFRERGEVFIESEEKQDLEAFLNNLPTE
jgi:ABC-type lipoprotein release transport system permease subunit